MNPIFPLALVELHRDRACVGVAAEGKYMLSRNASGRLDSGSDSSSLLIRQKTKIEIEDSRSKVTVGKYQRRCGEIHVQTFSTNMFLGHPHPTRDIQGRVDQRASNSSL